MRIPPYATFDDIVRTTSRLPFSEMEVAFLAEALDGGRRRGRDCHFGRVGAQSTATEIERLMGEGVVLLASPGQLQQNFMFAKCDAGRSLFGKQKAVFKSFVGSPDYDEWMIGPIFRTWALAATSIGNVYRGQGYS